MEKITRGLPKGRQAVNDRAPTIEEIHKLLEYPDRRIKPIILTMASSGIRLGTRDLLQWKHIEPITEKNGEIIAAKVLQALVYFHCMDMLLTWLLSIWDMAF